jgi:hypothetical protein
MQRSVTFISCAASVVLNHASADSGRFLCATTGFVPVSERCCVAAQCSAAITRCASRSVSRERSRQSAVTPALVSNQSHPWGHDYLPRWCDPPTDSAVSVCAHRPPTRRDASCSGDDCPCAVWARTSSTAATSAAASSIASSASRLNLSLAVPIKIGRGSLSVSTQTRAETAPPVSRISVCAAQSLFSNICPRLVRKICPIGLGSEASLGPARWVAGLTWSTAVANVVASGPTLPSGVAAAPRMLQWRGGAAAAACSVPRWSSCRSGS